jgi:hypothetical protein
MLSHATASVLLLLAGFGSAEFPGASATTTASVIPADDYALYDQVVIKKFLTSQTRLVVLERVTVSRLLPDQKEPTTISLFDERGYFDGALPRELIRAFVEANREPARLEGRFRFGVRYRFVSGNAAEEPEVQVGRPVSADDTWPALAPSLLDRLAFSRVGRTIRNDQALLYVELVRPDGTGAGFLVWFRRRAQEWTIVDTEVVWTARDETAAEYP